MCETRVFLWVCVRWRRFVYSFNFALPGLRRFRFTSFLSVHLLVTLQL